MMELYIKFFNTNFLSKNKNNKAKTPADKKEPLLIKSNRGNIIDTETIR